MNITVTNLYQALVDALHARGDAAPDRPVTVAEIYQELVPYRGVRETLGFELNADYEHALLRLLAGEDELLRLEPTSARDELRQELESPNPYVGLYRKFAACDVWVKFAPRAAEPVAEPIAEPITEPIAARMAPESAPSATAPASAPAADPAGAPTPAQSAAPAPAPAEPMPITGRPEARDATDEFEGPDNCPFCRTSMPVGRKARYCPQCGGDQRSRPCARCGDVLDHAWRYCISCGAAAVADAAPRSSAR
jgi:hypothetical protein